MSKVIDLKLLLAIMISFITLLSPTSASPNSKLGAQAYLKTNVWQPYKRYNASHFLMIPMFYAYEKGDKELQRDFDFYVNSFFEKNGNKLDFKSKQQRLNDTQFLYFLTTYAVLSKNKYPQYTKQMLQDVEDIWHRIPAWQWGEKPFTNLKQRLDWKMQADQKVGFHRAIIDEEFFTLGAAANLSRIYPNNPTLKEINHYTAQIFKQRSTLDNGRWLFDVGTWDNHPTFAYSGYSDTKNITVKKPKKNIVADASHFMRMPILLWSFQGAFPKDSKENFQFKSYRVGLEKQFFERVVVRKGDTILMNNFMDGSNGVFRWEYPSLGKGKGYGPYELTHTLGMGLWTLLPGTRVQDLYKDYYKQIRNSDKQISCESMMVDMLKGRKSKYDFKLIDCVHLFNTELASKISDKRM
ncbi:hypothetical protein [Acinetobacter sp. BMW17]|uniref:hypothetical protein n=1 Tax=Acinetobacter sp. BMW17 TaxID=1795629 RepID=UPI0007845553|nr:hypothetical protein [Acinetobacter sp. BMW17]